MRKDAIISECGQYRYMLSRSWDSARPSVTFVGLNPSTADASEDDPTIRRMISFAEREGAGGILVVNLFAFRSTDPSGLHEALDPIGKGNDDAIYNAMLHSSKVIYCWGINGRYMGRDVQVAKRHYKALCFGKTVNGYPKHPLYLPSDAPLIPFFDNQQ